MIQFGPLKMIPGLLIESSSETRLDEIPQLISVIKGEMSLIVQDLKDLNEKDLLNNIPNYDLRHSLSLD